MDDSASEPQDIHRRRVLGLHGPADGAAPVAPAGGSGATAPTPFKVDIPDHVLGEIKRRVVDCNFPRTGPTGWDIGPDHASMRRLADYWCTGYDWRAQERRINRFPQYRVAISGDLLHYVHVQAPGSNGKVLVILHGWPYTFASLLGLVDPLIHPERHGGNARDAVDVVIPSLPGFAFSESAQTPIGPRAMADRIDTLVTEVLGYNSYRAHGGDWGGYIASWLGYEHPRCVAVDLTVSLRNSGLRTGIVDPGVGEISPENHAKTIEAQGTLQRSFAYFQQQGYRPTTIGYFSDSPVGAAQWIIDKYYLWSDRRIRSFEQIFSMDQLLTEVMLYVATDSFATGLWVYEGAYEEDGNTLPQGARVERPTGFSAFPDPLVPPPTRAELQKVYDVVQYAQFDSGGHFPFYENPSALLQGIGEFLQVTTDLTS
ncbi:epoxide hydrolase family protein [Streptomyces sp. NPDC059744]|uniref:epoxide hydrolase family protein n=1 Tax=Streptomyces sp. NPDC059744 TaxID=3346929 RepID=UPI0036697640